MTITIKTDGDQELVLTSEMITTPHIIEVYLLGEDSDAISISVDELLVAAKAFDEKRRLEMDRDKYYQ